jgi:hypothetical protein
MTGDPDWRFIHGRDAAAHLRRRLAAGPLTATLSGLDLLDVRFGDTEIIRRLAVRVRDEGWRTIPGSPEEVTATEDGERFSVRLAARCRSAGLDLATKVEMSATGDGSLVMEMSGEALAESRVNRLGLVILHPLSVAGRAWRASGNGVSSEGTLPALIGPQAIRDGVELPLFPAFDHLEIDLAGDTTLVFDLAGDLFEMEDQRNWSDGSFKTYSTPLAEPIPRVLRPGEKLHQRLAVTLRGRAITRPAPRRMKVPAGIAVGGHEGARLLPLGTLLGDDLPGAAATELLRRSPPAFLHAEVMAGDTARLADVAAVAATVGVKLSLALVLATQEIDPGRDLAAIGGLPLARLALLPADGGVTPMAWLAEASGKIDVPVVAGTRADFMGINREQPKLPAGAGLIFAMTPEVHDEDDEAIIHSLEAQPDMIRTAKAIAPGVPIHVGPLTLKPRRLAAPGVTGGPDEIDHRDGTLFAAAFLSATAGTLSEAGAASLAAFRVAGAGGLIAMKEDGSASPTPAFHVAAFLNTLRGAPLHIAAPSDGLRARALICEREGGLGGMVVSLVSDASQVRLTGLPAGRYRTSRLEPNGWEERESVAAPGGGVDVPLTAYGITRIESA